MKDNLWAGDAQPNINFLLRVVKLPVVVIVLVEIILTIFTERYWQEVYWWLDYNFYVMIGLKVAAAFWLAYLLFKAIEKKIGLKTPAYTAGALAGFLAGLLIAIFKIFWYHKFWTFFNLIAEPLLMALAGAILVRLFVMLMAGIFNRKL